MGTLNIESFSDHIRIRFPDRIDEDTVFPDVFSGAAEGADLVIDFKGLETINSPGVRGWVEWVRNFGPEKRVEMVNCPPCIVDQLNLMCEFLPEGALIRSFDVLYFCPECDRERTVLFERGRDFSAGAVDVKSDLPCPQCGGRMDLDVIESQYFWFIRR